MARKSASPKRLRALGPTASDASQQQQQQQQQPDDGASSANPNPPRRKRGRPSLAEKKSPAAAQGQGKKKTGPAARGQKKGADASAQEPDGEAQPSKAGRKRKSRVSFQEDPQEADEQQQQQPPAKRKRGRPSLKDRAASEADKTPEAADGPVRKKRGRPPGKRSSLQNQEPSASGRRSTAADQDEPQSRASSRRRSSQIAQLEADAPPKPYPHIAPSVRGVKQSTIDAKWNPLSAASIAAATETLTLAHRPIMQRMASTQQRRQHTTSALSLLHRRISRKLQRGLPFPPAAVPMAVMGPRKRGRPRAGGHESELDFESVLDGAQALERQLDPALHAVELLRKEKERMERELERDYKTLRNLEAGAKGQARQQREQLKKAHVMAPEAATPREKREDDVEMVFDNKGSVPPGAVFKDLDDGELKDLALQLSGHMESVKTNLQQTEGLVPQMASTGAALRSVLLRHLGQEQYDKVVLGQ